ncbi:MAG: hypothetical protein QXD51_01735 [Candidatus Anstonellales archaeon]
MKYKINRWLASYGISEKEIDDLESIAFSMKLKMEVRYKYAQGSQWKMLDRIFFYEGEKRTYGNTKAEIISKENGGYELVIYDKKIDERWKNKQ